MVYSKGGGGTYQYPKSFMVFLSEITKIIYPWLYLSISQGEDSNLQGWGEGPQADNVRGSITAQGWPSPVSICKLVTE